MPKRYEIIERYILGSSSSGNWGHAGRPGKRGGSVPRGRSEVALGSGGIGIIDPKFLSNVPNYDDEHDQDDYDYNWDRMLEGGDYDRQLAELFGTGKSEAVNTFELFAIGEGEARLREQKIKDLSDELGVPKNELYTQFEHWTSPESPVSLMLQKEVASYFDIPLSGYSGELFDKYKALGKLSDTEVLSTKHKPEGKGISDKLVFGDGSPTMSSDTRRTFISGLYEKTQNELRDALPGRTHVRVYRGTRNPEVKPFGQGDSFELEGSVLSSWSASPAVARTYVAGFGGKVLAMDVPIERVFSLGTSGLGEKGQGELLIIGGVSDTVEVYDASWD